MKQKTFFRLFGFLSILLLATVLVACGAEDSADEGEFDPVLVEEGEAIVETSCIGCHATDLSGDYGPSLLDLTLSKEEIIGVLENGRGEMPAGVADGEEEAVATYLLSIK